MESNYRRADYHGSPIKNERGTNNSALIISKSSQLPQVDVDQSLADLGFIMSNSRCEVCRICLQESGQMIAPCNCRGSIEFVHERCMKEWICKAVATQIKWIGSNEAEINCEMCKAAIHFNVRRVCHCRKNSLKEIFARQARAIMVKIVVMVFLLGASSFLSVVASQSFTAQSQDSTLSVNLGLAIVSLIMVVVLMALFIWQIVTFVRDYLTKTTVDISGIGEDRNLAPLQSQISPRRKPGTTQIMPISSPNRNRTSTSGQLLEP